MGGVLFKFVVDIVEDLLVGIFYGVKFIQDVGQNDFVIIGFVVEWVELVSGDNLIICVWIDEYNGIGIDDYVDG